MKFKIYNGRKHFYQYDRDQKIVIESNAPLTELHFSAGGQDDAYCMPVYEEGSIRVCDVPNVLLEQHGNLIVYAWIDEYTKEHFVFSVIQRKMPNDFVPASEIKKWSSLDERVTKLEENGTGNCVASWNDLEDKPFGDETVEKVILGESNFLIPYNFYQDFHIESFPTDLTESPLVDGETYIVTFNGVEQEAVCVSTLNGTEKQYMFPILCEEDGYSKPLEYDGIMFNVAVGYVVKGDSVSLMIQVEHDSNSDVPVTLGIKQIQGNVKQLDEKYIPNTIARVEDIPTGGVSEEEVASAIEKYMTENPVEIPSDVVTEEELEERLKDMPSASGGGVDITYEEETKTLVFSGGSGSSGSEKWELIYSTTLEEEVAKILIDKDTNGNTFSLKKIMILATVVGSETNTVDDELRIGVNVENNTAYRIYTGYQGVRKLSSQTRTIFLKGEIAHKLLVGYASVPITDDTLLYASGNGTLNPLRLPMKAGSNDEYAEINDVSLIELYPKTSGCVLGKGTVVKVWGVRN